MRENLHFEQTPYLSAFANVRGDDGDKVPDKP